MMPSQKTEARAQLERLHTWISADTQQRRADYFAEVERRRAEMAAAANERRAA